MLASISLQDKWNRLYARHQRGILKADERLNLLLQTGVDAFGMEIGVISHIQGNSFTILYSSHPKSVCLQYPLNKTFCQIPFKTREILTIENASDSHSLHSGRTQFGVEAYFGIPLMIKGRVYGTMAFIQGYAHEPFSEGEKNLLRQLARKAENILASELAET